MERNTLELACNSLFIEKIKNGFQAAKDDLLEKVYSFSIQRSYDPDPSSIQAAKMPIDQNADAFARAGILLPLILRQGRAQRDEIIKHHGQTVANTVSQLNFLFIRLKTPSQGKFP